eukprot:17602-Heterococcus_DN1.PRE.1
MRRKLVAQRFVMTLTGGSQMFEAHDAVRYIGDMLAWVHQTAAMEKELLTALFGQSTSAAAAATTGDTNSSSAAAAAVSQPGAPESQVTVAAVTVEEALSRVLKGVARPLQGRVTTVLEDCSDAVTTYKLMGYLAFYCETVSFEVPCSSTAALSKLAQVSNTPVKVTASNIKLAVHVAACMALRFFTIRYLSSKNESSEIAML